VKPLSEYSTFINELLNNYKSYNLYFAIIYLVKLAIKNNIVKYQLLVDVKYLTDLIRAELSSSAVQILDINDGLQALTDITLQQYNENDLIILMRGFNIET
jgi:hypothetical protein